MIIHLLGCIVLTSTQMDHQVFCSEVNDRHGLSTVWAPCIHPARHKYRSAVQPCELRNTTAQRHATLSRCFLAALLRERWNRPQGPPTIRAGFPFKSSILQLLLQ